MNPGKKIGVVYDCMVLLQGAAREASPAGTCLTLVERGIIELFLSPEVVAEVTEVLNRPWLQKKFPILTAEYVAEFMHRLVGMATLVTVVPKQFHLERDPKDERYINLALTAGVQYLVSRDKDLLDLMNEDDVEGKKFRQRFPPLTIIEPVTFLRKLSLEQQ